MVPVPVEAIIARARLLAPLAPESAVTAFIYSLLPPMMGAPGLSAPVATAGIYAPPPKSLFGFQDGAPGSRVGSPSAASFAPPQGLSVGSSLRSVNATNVGVFTQLTEDQEQRVAVYLRAHGMHGRNESLVDGLSVTHKQLVTIVADATGLTLHSLAVSLSIDRYFAQIDRVWTPIPPAPGRIREQTAWSTAINLAWHANAFRPALPEKPESDTTIQVQFTEGDSVQTVYQIGYNVTTGATQILAGGQVQTDDKDAVILYGKVRDALDRGFRRLVTAQAFGQILGGVATTGDSAGGTVVMLQPSAGGQISINFNAIQLPRGLKFARNASLVIQDSVSMTAQSGQDTTVENNLTLQLTFTIPDP